MEIDERLVGVAMVGRPVSRELAKDRFLTEVTRLATDGSENACSMLYGACRRAAKALGYRKAQTYLLETESGVSLKASGWRPVAKTDGGSWDRPARSRVDSAPTCPKVRWEVVL